MVIVVIVVVVIVVVVWHTSWSLAVVEVVVDYQCVEKEVTHKQ